MPIDSKDRIILVALENELPQNILPNERIEYTGVGKINATIKALEVIQKYNTDMIVNFGTAGSLHKKIIGLHEVSIFKQRDMDATGLGFSIGETPFENVSSITFGREGLSCGTGDSFVTEKPKKFAEYTKAKKEGEVMSKELYENLLRVRIACPRLPRLNTDQNQSLIPVKSENPVPVIISLLKDPCNFSPSAFNVF